MAPTSLPNAKADLYNCLASDAAGSPVSAISSYVGKVYSGEPRPGDLLTGEKATVTIWTTRMDGTSFFFTVRVYQHTAHDAIIAQTNLDNALWAVERALSSEFERPEWVTAYDPNIHLMMAEAVVTSGRQDF